jgi:hypothetical protein
MAQNYGCWEVGGPDHDVVVAGAHARRAHLYLDLSGPGRALIEVDNRHASFRLVEDRRLHDFVSFEVIELGLAD